MTHCTHLLLLLLISQTNAVEQTDNWLAAPEYKPSVGIRLGIDEDNHSLWGFDTQLVTPYNSVLTLEWFQSNSHTTQELAYNNYFVELSSDPLATWSMAISYEYSGNKNVLDVSNITGSIQYYPSNWLLNIGYINGEISNFVQPSLRTRTLLSPTIDQTGYTIEAHYYSGAWSWQLEGQVLNYNKDLTKAKNNRQLRRLISQQTLSDIFTLIEWQIHTSVTYDWDKSALRFGITHYQQAVEKKESSNIVSNIDYPLSDSLSIAAMLARSLDDSLLYTELSARYQW